MNPKQVRQIKLSKKLLLTVVTCSRKTNHFIFSRNLISEGEGMATTIIKAIRWRQKNACVPFQLRTRKLQENMSSLEEWNTKHILSDDAVILTVLGRCLQYIVCICSSVEKKQVTSSIVWFHLYKIKDTHTHPYTTTIHTCTENLPMRRGHRLFLFILFCFDWTFTMSMYTFYSNF